LRDWSSDVCSSDLWPKVISGRFAPPFRKLLLATSRPCALQKTEMRPTPAKASSLFFSSNEERVEHEIAERRRVQKPIQRPCHIAIGAGDRFDDTAVSFE